MRWLDWIREIVCTVGRVEVDDLIVVAIFLIELSVLENEFHYQCHYLVQFLTASFLNSID